MLKVNEKKTREDDEIRLSFLCNLSSLISDYVTKIVDLSSHYENSQDIIMGYVNLVVRDLVEEGKFINELMLDKLLDISEGNHHE